MSRSTTINLGRAPNGSACVLGSDERKAVQSAYGGEFTDEMWAEILYVTSQLTEWEPISQNSASFKKTLATLHRLGKLAKSLRGDIAPQRTPVGEFTPEEIWYAFFCVRKRPPKVDDFFVFLLEILDPLIAMDDFAAKHEKDNGKSVTLPKGPYKGFYWEFWVLALCQLFERHGLPVTTRKDTDKKRFDEQSPFVRFVAKFQEYLPEQCRKFTHSNDGLTQAIYRVRYAPGGAYNAQIENDARKAFRDADGLIEQAEQAESAKLARRVDARKWRLRDFRAILGATLDANGADAKAEEDMELCLASNEAADLVREENLDAAEQAAKALLDRFPDAHDGYDRLGMVHEARGDKQKAAECYRKVIEVIRRQPENYEPDSEQTFAKLIDQLDSPA